MVECPCVILHQGHMQTHCRKQSGILFMLQFLYVAVHLFSIVQQYTCMPVLHIHYASRRQWAAWHSVAACTSVNITLCMVCSADAFIACVYATMSTSWILAWVHTECGKCVCIVVPHTDCDRLPAQAIHCACAAQLPGVLSSVVCCRSIVRRK